MVWGEIGGQFGFVAFFLGGLIVWGGILTGSLWFGGYCPRVFCVPAYLLRALVNKLNMTCRKSTECKSCLIYSACNNQMDR